MNSVEIQDKKSQLYARCEEIINTCKKEIRTMNEDEKAEFEENKRQMIDLNEQLRKLQEELNSYSMEDVEKEENKENKQVNNTRTMKKRFNLLKAINDQINNRSFDAETLAVIDAGKREFEASNLNITGSIVLPTNETRTVAVTATTAEHDDVIEIDMQSILMPNYANTVMAAAGAKVITGAKGDIKYPIMDKSSCAWLNELEEASSGDPTFSSVTLTPKRISCVVEVSKQLLAQDSIGVQDAIMSDIRRAFEDKVEASILGSFSGDTKQPAGIFSDSATTLTDWASMCDFEATVEESNTTGEKVYICSPKAKAKLRAMDKGGKHTELVYENGGVDGTRVLVSSNVPEKKLVYGNFSNYVIVQWGGYEIVVDTFTSAAKGAVRLIASSYVSFAPLRKSDYALGQFA